MKTGFLITARMGSSRLKDKHFLLINGKPILLVLIKRICNMFMDQILRGISQIIIASPDTPDSDIFNIIAPGIVSVFRGSSNNIPLRHLQASDMHDCDVIISIDGDDPLCSVDGMMKVQKAIFSGEEYAKTSDLPLGMNSIGYSREFLRKSVMPYIDHILENGWGWIFDKSKLMNIIIGSISDNQKLRFTLDYQEDYIFFKNLIEPLGEEIRTISDIDIVERVVSKKLYELNEKVADEYWNNFNQKQKCEMGNEKRL